MIRRPGAILTLLTGLNFLNYLDRTVMPAVLPKVQADLHLSNFIGGLLATVFLVGYSVTAPVFGSLGDRMARKWLIAIGIILWSAATCASGLATSAAQLIVARACVGVGEASYAVLAPTIIDDITSPQRKGRALAIFYGAIPVGAAMGNIVGGFVEARWGWRNAFFVAGGPGLVLALVCVFIVEPKRRLVEKPAVARDLMVLLRTKLYRQAVLGYCASTAAVGAFAHWGPTFLVVNHGLPLEAANRRFGLVLVVSGLLATFIGGKWADVMRARVERERAAEDVDRLTVQGLLRICAIGAFLSVPFAFLAFLSRTPGLFLVLLFLCILTLFLSNSPINAALLRSVPAELRASAMAVSLFSIHAFGDFWSPPFVGRLADKVFPMREALLWTLPTLIAAAALLWWPRRARTPQP